MSGNQFYDAQGEITVRYTSSFFDETSNTRITPTSEEMVSDKT